MYRGLMVVGDYVDEAYTDLDHDVRHWFSQGTTDEKETRLLWKQAVEAYGADVEYEELPEEFREKVMQVGSWPFFFLDLILTLLWSLPFQLRKNYKRRSYRWELE